MRRYAWHRVRRIMPAYVVTVLVAFLIYHFRTAGPNPGHSWIGLLRNLTLTQIYTDNYMFSYLHQGLTQMWSLAVEVAFYVALPVLAYLLLVVLCRRRWRPVLLLAGLAGAGVGQPGVAGAGAHHRFPARRRPAVAARLSGLVHRRHAADGVAGHGRSDATGSSPCRWRSSATSSSSTPIAGEPTTSPTGLAQALVKTGFYAAIATLLVAPLALGNRGWYAGLLASRPMVWLGEISYEIFLVHLVVMEIAMVEVLHWPVYTGSAPALFVVTLVMTIPVAWVLHRFTRVRSGLPRSAVASCLRPGRPSGRRTPRASRVRRRRRGRGRSAATSAPAPASGPADATTVGVVGPQRQQEPRGERLDDLGLLGHLRADGRVGGGEPR